MDNHPVAKHVVQAGQSVATLMAYLSSADYIHRGDDPANCDFVFGNPNDMPLQGFVDALQKWAVPQNKDWFAYKLNEPNPGRPWWRACWPGAECNTTRKMSS